MEMRRRSVWEAADSGILLWRDNFFYFIPFYVLPVWIAASALLCIPDKFRWVSWFCLWWLKPLFERLCVQVAAARFFRNTPNVVSRSEPDYRSSSPWGFQKIIKGLPGIIFLHLLGDLLWRRFSPFRPSTMCLRLLERPKQRQYEERKNALVSGGLHFSALTTSLGLLLEAILLGGEILFVLIIFEIFFPHVPAYTRMKFLPLFGYAAYCVNYVLVGSFSVCTGFGIYINSRTAVEGWDIELLFRNLAMKSQQGVKTVLFVFGLVFFFFSPGTQALEAQDLSFPDIESVDEVEFINGVEFIEQIEEGRDYFPPGFIPVEEIKWETLEEILSSDDFGKIKPSWSLRYKHAEELEKPVMIDFEPWLENLKETIALILRALVVLVIAGFVIFFFIYQLHRSRSKTRNHYTGRGAYSNPLTPEENPELTFQRAEELFRKTLYREAWAACFCGTISAFGKYLALSFPVNATEYDCLALVQSQAPPSAEGFGDLVRNWVLLAYGGRVPGEGSFERALEYGRSVKKPLS
jgi:hypothetical protein